MDIKIKGIDRSILEMALAQALEGRLFILNKMLEVMVEPRKSCHRLLPRLSPQPYTSG